MPAILQYARDVYYIGNLEIARLGKGTVAFFNIDREPIEKAPTHIDWDAEAAEKAGYEHFMMKEIHEQPKAARDTLHALIKDDQIDLSAAELDDALLRAIRQIVIVACGSAYHVGVAAQYIIEGSVAHTRAGGNRQRVPLPQAHLRREARWPSSSANPAKRQTAWPRCVRQKRMVSRTLGIVNVVGSSIAREADSVLYTLAGPEIAVATTKAYSTQLIACYALALQLAQAHGTLGAEEYADDDFRNANTAGQDRHGF